jgi:hypothetical protein
VHRMAEPDQFGLKFPGRGHDGHFYSSKEWFSPVWGDMTHKQHISSKNAAAPLLLLHSCTPAEEWGPWT